MEVGITEFCVVQRGIKFAVEVNGTSNSSACEKDLVRPPRLIPLSQVRRVATFGMCGLRFHVSFLTRKTPRIMWHAFLARSSRVTTCFPISAPSVRNFTRAQRPMMNCAGTFLDDVMILFLGSNGLANTQVSCYHSKVSFIQRRTGDHLF